MESESFLELIKSVMSDPWFLTAIAMVLIYFIEQVVSKKTGLIPIPLYLIFGAVCGASFLDIFNSSFLYTMRSTSTLATVIVAFFIGAELTFDTIKRLGKSIMFIALGEVMVTAILVFVAMQYIAHLPLALSLILSAVASATAPAAIVFVIKKYKAKGNLTTTILGVTGIDDVWSLILFSFASVISYQIISDTGDISMVHMVLGPLKHIVVSLAIGSFLGYLASVILKQVTDTILINFINLSFMFCIVGLSDSFSEISSLMSIMGYGAMLANMNELVLHRSVKGLKPIYDLIIPIFFLFIGSTLNIEVAKTTFWIGILYTVVRFAGKYSGAFIGGAIAGSPISTRNNIGLALLPQLGVSIGILLVVQTMFSGTGPQGEYLISVVSSILVWTTIITEWVGPVLVKFALGKVGEINADKESEGRSRIAPMPDE